MYFDKTFAVAWTVAKSINGYETHKPVRREGLNGELAESILDIIGSYTSSELEM